jgi:hypothetical protein
MQPPPLSERFTLGLAPYTCDEVTDFIGSLNRKSSLNDFELNDFEAICNILQLFDFDTCRFFSDTKNKTFDFFEILLRKFKEDIIEHSSLSRSLTFFLVRFDFLKKAFDLDDKRSLFQKVQQNVDIKTEFFKRYGGNTIANKNIYDLVIYKKQKQNQRIAKGAELRMAPNIGGVGKRQPNRKKASHIRVSKKRFHSRKSHRKNKSRRKN